MSSTLKSILGKRQVHPDPPPKGKGEGVWGERPLLPLRKLRCVGQKSWRKLKAVLQTLQKESRVKKKIRGGQRPRQADTAPQNALRQAGLDMEYPAGRQSTAAQREAKRWQFVAQQEKRYGELSKEEERRLREFLKGG